MFSRLCSQESNNVIHIIPYLGLGEDGDGIGVVGKGEGSTHFLPDQITSPLPPVSYQLSKSFGVFNGDDLEEEGDMPSYFGRRHIKGGESLMLDHARGVCIDERALFGIGKRGFLCSLLDADGARSEGVDQLVINLIPE